MGVYGTTIVVGATPVVNGSSGAVLFDDGSVKVGGSSNFNWDNTNGLLTALNYASVGVTRTVGQLYSSGYPAHLVVESNGNADWQFACVDSTVGPLYAGTLSVYADLVGGQGAVFQFLGGKQGEAGYYVISSDVIAPSVYVPFANSVSYLCDLLPIGPPTNALTVGRPTQIWKSVYTGNVTMGLAGTVTGSMNLKGTTSGNVTVTVGAAAGTWSMTLPSSAGSSGQFLQTNGSGVTTWATATSGITVGTTAITSGTSGRVLYDNAGVVGEMTTTGSGTVLVLQTAPTLTGPVVLNEAVGSSGLTITGATQTSSFPALNVTQTWNNAATTFIAHTINVTDTASSKAANNNASKFVSYQVGGTEQLRIVPNQGLAADSTAILMNGSYRGLVFDKNIGELTFVQSSNGVSGEMSVESAAVKLAANVTLAWNSANVSRGGTKDTFLVRAAAANVQYGQDVNGPAVNQTISAANGITGTDKTGANLTMDTGKGTGIATPSAFIVRTPTVLGSGTTAQTLTERVRIDSGGLKLTTATPFSVASGTNQRAGDATLVGGTVTVSNTTVTANTRVYLQRKTAGGTIGTSETYTVSAGTSFTITSNNVLDTSVMSYFLVEVP